MRANPDGDLIFTWLFYQFSDIEISCCKAAKMFTGRFAVNPDRGSKLSLVDLQDDDFPFFLQLKVSAVPKEIALLSNKTDFNGIE
jgi:hypothetical protein